MMVGDTVDDGLTPVEVMREMNNHLILTMSTLADATTKNRSKLMGSTVRLVKIIKYLEGRLIKAESGHGDYSGVISQIIDQTSRFSYDAADTARLILSLAATVEGEAGKRIISAANHILNISEEISGKNEAENEAENESDDTLIDDGSTIRTLNTRDK